MVWNIATVQGLQKRLTLGIWANVPNKITIRMTLPSLRPFLNVIWTSRMDGNSANKVIDVEVVGMDMSVVIRTHLKLNVDRVRSMIKITWIAGKGPINIGYIFILANTCSDGSCQRRDRICPQYWWCWACCTVLDYPTQPCLGAGQLRDTFHYKALNSIDFPASQVVKVKDNSGINGHEHFAYGIGC